MAQGFTVRTAGGATFEDIDLGEARPHKTARIDTNLAWHGLQRASQPALTRALLLLLCRWRGAGRVD
jgi:hypothetical protein